MALTPQQELFCRQFVARKFNGPDAYGDAYPKASPASRGPAASRLLANVKIQERWQEIAREAAASAQVTPEMVLRELGFIAFQRGSQIRRPDGTLKGPSEWDEATDATIAGVEIEEELVPDTESDAEESREPQGHGGELKRSKLKVKVVRTTKVHRWNKDRALKVFMEHFGLLKEPAPHPDRPKLDLTNLSEDQKRALLDFFRALRRA